MNLADWRTLLIGESFHLTEGKPDVNVRSLQLWLITELGYSPEGPFPEELSYQTLVDLLCDLLFCARSPLRIVGRIIGLMENQETPGFHYGKIVHLAGSKNSCELSRQWARRILKEAAQDEKHRWHKGAKATLQRLGAES